MRLPPWVADAGYGAGWRLIRTVPEPIARAVFRMGADVATRREGPAVQQLRRNLARVIGPQASVEELNEAVAAGMRSYARYWLETFRLPAMDKAAVLRATRVTGLEHLRAARDAGRGIIFALPHSGNWDIAGLWLVQQGLSFTTVAERLKPDSLFDRFVAYREGLGMEVLPLTGGDRSPTRTLLERLRAGGTVCLLADRDLSGVGIPVDFFGERTKMPGGPARLAASTGAALMPVHLYFEPDGWGQWIGAPIDLGEGDLTSQVVRGTQALADAFAAHIAEHPTDWHMLQRLWLADLVPASSEGAGTPDGDAAVAGTG